MTLTGVSKTDAVGAAQRRLGAGTMLWVQSLCLTGLTPVRGKDLLQKTWRNSGQLLLHLFLFWLPATGGLARAPQGSQG